MIILGVVFLLGNMHVLTWHSLGVWFARYWPVLIIIWGVVKLVEYYQALPPQFGEIAAPASWRLEEARRTFEERFVRAALVRTGGRRAEAAAELGVTRQGLTKLITRLGISTDG